MSSIASAFPLSFNMPAVVLQTEYVSPQAFYGAASNKEGTGPLTHYLYPPPARHTLTANSTGMQAVKSTFRLSSAADWVMVVHHSAFPVLSCLDECCSTRHCAEHIAWC